MLFSSSSSPLPPSAPLHLILDPPRSHSLLVLLLLDPCPFDLRPSIVDPATTPPRRQASMGTRSVNNCLFKPARGLSPLARPLSWRQFEGSWGPFGASRGLFWASWGPLGALLGRLRRLLGRHGAILSCPGPLLGRLGAIGDCLGPVFGPFWGPWPVLGASWAFWGPSGAV